MKRAIVTLAFIVGACGAPSSSQPESVQASAPAAEIAAPPAETAMIDVATLPTPTDLEGEVRGARNADPARWPASLYSRSSDGMCTSTLVGERVLLTAAHCVPNGGVVTFNKVGRAYRAICEHAPGYGAGNETADYALCAVETPVTGVRYERINTNETLLRVGQELLLTGFGCTRDDGAGGNDGIYRIGESPISALPTPPSDNDIETNGQAGLCFGDSGGPAFHMTGARRVQVSVNSRVENRRRDGVDLGPRSYLSSTSTPEALAFFRDWRTRNNLLICGLDTTAANCR